MKVTVHNIQTIRDAVAWDESITYEDKCMTYAVNGVLVEVPIKHHAETWDPDVQIGDKLMVID